MERMSKGLTLIELMAVIVIISLIAILTFPNIVNQINKSKKANNDNIKTLVIEAAKKYVSDNVNDFDSDEYCIPISELESNNYIEESIIATGDDISNMGIIYKNNNYSIAKCESGGS